MADYKIKRLFNNVLVFVITREHVLNAVNDQVMDGLNQACDIIRTDPDYSLFVITGEGERAFCSGGDLREFHALKTANQSVQMLQKMAHILHNIATLPVPVIGLLNGTAVGGGMEIASACDWRYARETGKYGFIQASLSITTGWGGGTLLLEKFPPHLALEWLAKGEKRAASDWQQDRFFNNIFSGKPFDFFEKECHSMLKTQSDVLRSYKEVFLKKIDQPSLLDRMLNEAKNCSLLWESNAHHEAVTQFLQKDRKTK
ncbi:enoyl-CoA hydratase/carnithine racemase [Bacillus oleivorans]|uniref:Enoyl-CoA hydratase/carnithine racemase n=1 Tax=Bacillus oleivorans TaxID=1448271 RepID=A0A285D0R3_9BACI|nr:enoyl-CoA hydratase/isomerase family protein [Bacillus oleivorans]SNX73392.1 enoyl-CoA hydratase/carnithine racemase [Bacillus oleivorans]